MAGVSVGQSSLRSAGLNMVTFSYSVLLLFIVEGD